MKAIAIDDFGVPPSLHDLPVPEPGKGEVLVRVEASSVNGIDVAVADGYRKGTAEPRFPVVLGRDFAGTVEAAGAGVQSLLPGDAVFGVVTTTVPGNGAFGEYTTAPQAYPPGSPPGWTSPRPGRWAWRAPPPSPRSTRSPRWRVRGCSSRVPPLVSECSPRNSPRPTEPT